MILRLASIVGLGGEAAASGGRSGCVSPQPYGRASFWRRLRQDRSAERTRRPSPLASRQQGRTSSTRASASEGAGSRATLRDGIGLRCGAARTRMPARLGVIRHRTILIRLLWLPMRPPQLSREPRLNLSSRWVRPSRTRPQPALGLRCRLRVTSGWRGWRRLFTPTPAPWPRTPSLPRHRARFRLQEVSAASALSQPHQSPKLCGWISSRV
jgi:hypothetical protein